MPAPWRRGVYEKVEYVVVERDGVEDEVQLKAEEPTATANRVLRRSQARRQEPTPTDMDYETDDEDEDGGDDLASQTATTITTPTLLMPSGPPALLITMTLSETQATSGALADNDPTATVVVAIPPPPKPHHDRGGGGISQTTEHLLIAAGSIGATIIIVMIVLGLYTMRKRGLTFSDVLNRGKQQMRRGQPPPPPSKYGMDKKQVYDDEDTYGNNDSVYAPVPAALNARSGSLSTQRPLQTLGRSDSFNQPPTRNSSVNRSFFDDTPSRPNSHRRNDSATPSSPVLPIEGQRRSASTRNTRSLNGDEEALRYSDPPQQQSSNPLPAPPTFKQFLSNRPTISQRPGIAGGAGGVASRFSWTNSNAPQTPHDPARDTVAQPIGRDSFMTSRSSVPRFRTVDSWVNQQSNRVQEQHLKQQFRMTQSTTYSDDAGDEVPEMPSLPPTVPKNASGMTRQPSAAGLARNGSKSGLVGRDIKHQRHDTTTTVQTAPIFKAHPGTEVRFSTRSAVPSEILDIGRHNAAL